MVCLSTCWIVQYEAGLSRSPHQTAANSQKGQSAPSNAVCGVCREDREDFDLKAAEGNTGNQKRGRPEGSAGGGGSGGRRVFVNNLAEETTWQALKEYFKQAGAVAHADVLAVRALPPARSSIRGIILPTCVFFCVSTGCEQGGLELPQLRAEVSRVRSCCGSTAASVAESWCCPCSTRMGHPRGAASWSSTLLQTRARPSP